MISETGLAELRRHEGFEARPYRDSVGVLTVGYGWNLESDPMYREAAEVQLKCKLIELEQRLLSLYDWYPNLSQCRKDVVLNMCYNLGLEGFGKFRQTIYYIARSRFEEAAAEMLRSKWAEQVGNRSRTLSEHMRTDR
jgi:lysozyme